MLLDGGQNEAVFKLHEEWLLTLRGIDSDIANKMFTNIQLLVFSLFGLRDSDNGEGERSVLSMTGAGFWMGLVGDSSDIAQRAKEQPHLLGVASGTKWLTVKV
jgi:hypothetical protein